MQQRSRIKSYVVRALAAVLLVTGAGLVSAQNEQQMQHMMEMMQRAQTCMSNIPAGKLDAMASKARQMEAEIKQLCAAGKRNEAQTLGMRYGQEMSNGPVARGMRKCSKMMVGGMAHMGSSIMPGMGFPDVKAMGKSHICDGY